MSVKLHHGDCLEVMARLHADGVRVDSVVCDPPYHLTSIVKRFGKTSQRDDTLTSERARGGADGMARLSRGFMGKQWDGGDIAFRPETWALALQLLKPGGHLVAFSGTRTYHRMACAIEDAGLEIRDQLAWVYGSGFPKSHNVASGIDKAAGVPPRGKAFNMKGRGDRADELNANGRVFFDSYSSQSDLAKPWNGWGTALKPAWEPICLARKPLIGTVAANVQQHGTGAINIDGCRVGDDVRLNPSASRNEIYGQFEGPETKGGEALGRWPANIVHDGSDEVVACFPETQSGSLDPSMNVQPSSGWSGGSSADRVKSTFEANAGSAARFFYTAKADSDDRWGSKHPTVKPVDLMRWLTRLVTPPGGTVLDPFAGSGTTGHAAFVEGFSAHLIEREAEYFADIQERMAYLEGNGRHSGVAKTRSKQQPATAPGPLFK